MALTGEDDTCFSCDPACACLIGFVTKRPYLFDFRSNKPLVHKITNKSDHLMFCIDAEILKSPPITSPIPLFAEYHTLIKERDRCRVYKLSLVAGESVTVSYPFFFLSVVLRGSRIKTSIHTAAGQSLSWEKDSAIGDEEWCNPAVDITITNLGEGTYEQFIAEWR
jgi:hypothetical protein